MDYCFINTVNSAGMVPTNQLSKFIIGKGELPMVEAEGTCSFKHPPLKLFGTDS